jgi:hypothetical protein
VINVEQTNLLQTPEGQPQIAAIQSPPFGFSFREWMAARRDLQMKKTLARDMVKRVAKNGINPEEGYRAVEAADVYDMMRPILSECKLGFEVEVIGERVEYSPNRAPITKVDLQITYMDLETGYFEQKTIVGTGLDWQDKGVYKAYTGGTKYALIMEFLIPTGGNDPVPGAGDPETDSNVKKSESKPGGDDAEAKQGTTPVGGRVNRRAGKDKDDGKKGHQSAQEDAPIGNDDEAAVTPEQIEAIRERVGRLNDFPDQSMEKRAAGIKATYMSIAAKIKIQKLDEVSISKLSSNQAEQAILCLDEWIDKRLQIDGRNKAGGSHS